ncbi:hypothetical protein KBTX_02494 [wastewater metagenome]|uniref:DUF2783 domain-containing protein n=2 Tax=unclassified sequences TaxID=12908 RepID=A0A5B8RF72_9ZZZZ|nr:MULTISPECIES: DUF2783 domain-containing protein [Arhodomonas]MCS4504473.1 DUF2783 domain-containing protein [Arhodomonas aquaeolei]QEA06164.1 hypothetical protein KBTEX_02494 [uncultured organism]
MASHTEEHLPFPELEAAYERIAETLDRLPERQTSLFLAKLSLALAHRVGDGERVRAAIDEAARDIGD